MANQPKPEILIAEYKNLTNTNLKDRLKCLSGETKVSFWKKKKSIGIVKRIKPFSNPPTYEYRSAELHWYDNDPANIYYYDVKVKFWIDNNWYS